MDCRSREGAWIEIALSANYNLGEGVAPARERGLKFWKGLYYEVGEEVAPARERGLKSSLTSWLLNLISRSREGAWIEMVCFLKLRSDVYCRSREGAWIEMALSSALLDTRAVAPARERGLKYTDADIRYLGHKSLPRGSVD